MSSVQTNVSFQNGVNGGNALQRALNEIDDYLLYLGTGHFSHVESTAPVIIVEDSNIIFPFIIIRVLFSTPITNVPFICFR